MSEPPTSRPSGSSANSSPATGATRRHEPTGAGNVGENLLGDAYAGLKGLLRRKFGGDSGVARAVNALEARPESDARRQVLAEEMKTSGADRDDELVEAATTQGPARSGNP